jgi:integration host factor subunit alpha
LNLTKADIVEKISEKTELPVSEIKDAVELLIETMKSTLASGEDIMISGFGKFQVNEKEPRKGRNPATGGAMMLKKRRVVTFKCSGKLRDQVNKAVQEADIL